MTYPVAQAFDDISHRYDTLVGLSPGGWGGRAHS